MAGKEQFQAESFESGEIRRGGCDEEGCVNYEPGMMAANEDELNEECDRAFAEEFFCDCEC